MGNDRPAPEGGPESSEAGLLPDTIEDLREEFGLERPVPGERWEFHLEDIPADRRIGRELISAGCDLRQEYADGDGRTYEYAVPEAGWPDPLGYVTTDEPEWVGTQHGWKQTGGFHGKVRGSIPSRGDCDRHPALPPDTYALTSVSIHAPGSDPRFHAHTTPEVPEKSWTVNLTYEQATTKYSAIVEVYSDEFGPFPECTKWESAPHTNDERRRVEFFETGSEAIAFVERETGLSVPDRPLDGGDDRNE